MSITLDRPSPILKINISKLLKVKTKLIGINSEVLLVVV
jgi:hypothetical protein